MTQLWSVDEFISRAEADTGLSDWGDEPFRDGLEVLVNSFNTESIPRFNPTEAGIAQERRELLLKLTERLKLVDWRKREPAIADEVIEKPIFVVGMPRSGTTITHRLLITDPKARFAAAWEVFYPSPPPERATCATDPRIRQAAEFMAGGGLTDDNFGAMHEYGATLSDECQHIFEYACRSTYQTGRIQKPGFIDWLSDCDIAPAYRFQKQLLQHLQYKCKGDYWILKSPQHLMHVPQLLDVFPDARIVVTHRNPRNVVPSLVSIMATLQALGMERADPVGEYAKWLKWLPDGMDDVETVRNDPRYKGQVIDVHFDDMTADPVRTIGAVRDELGIGCSADDRARVGAYMAENPRNKKGEHKYSLEQYGLDPAAIEEAFAGYLQRMDRFRRFTKG